MAIHASPEVADLLEMDSMLAEKIESWTEQWQRQGLEEGRWKGWQEGWQEGFQEGLIQGEVRLLQHLLEYRYGQLPDWVPAKLRQATEKQLFNWGERMFDASTLEEVFVNPTP